MTKEIERGNLERVVWVDPTSDSQWIRADDVETFFTDETFTTETVGWIVMEDKKAIAIASTINVTNTHVGQIFRIPKAVISEREVLRAAD